MSGLANFQFLSHYFLSFFFSFQQNLSPTDEISILAIEQTSSKSQRCFAAVRNSVFVFRLRDGFCITQIQDMHRRDVTDVLFCQSIRVGSLSKLLYPISFTFFQLLHNRNTSDMFILHVQFNVTDFLGAVTTLAQC